MKGSVWAFGPNTSRRATIRAKVGSLLAVASLLASILAVGPTVQPVLAASTWYVNLGGDGTAAGTGCNGTAFGSIQDAVDDAAADGDTIHVCAGTYNLVATVTTTLSLSFVGDGTSGGTATIIDGADARALFSSSASSITVRDMTLQNGVPAILAQNNVTVSGVAFSSNSADTALASDRGGAIASNGEVDVSASTFVGNIAADAGGAIAGTALITVRDSVFRENSAGSVGATNSAGGAIYGTYTITVSDSLFEDNTAGSDAEAGAGGAIHALNDLNVTDSVFHRNAAAGYGIGGALYEQTGTVTVTGSEFIANSTGNRGGAIYGEHAVTVTGGRFEDNSAGSGDTYRGYGGAIFSNDPVAILAISGASFERNIATGDGGAVYGYATVNAASSYFGDNSASTDSGNGGAIFAYGASSPAFTVRTWNSTFSGNKANEGGAVYGLNAGVFGRNLTFSGNTFGSATGGAIRTTNEINDVGNSIFASATDTCSGPIIDRGGNIAVTDGSAISGCVDTGTSREIASAGPLDLGTPALNAPGTTKTIALGATSVAIGYGIRSLCADPATVNDVDQRGVSRDQWTGCDSGAYEAPAGPGAYIVGTGTQSCTAYASIQAAVDATTGGTIHVCGTHDLTAGVVVTKDLTFEGDSSTSTFVDGQGLYRLFLGWTSPNTYYSLTFRDMTLRNGYVDYTSDGMAAKGGGVLAGNVYGERVRFTGNTAFRDSAGRAQGGGLYARCASGSPCGDVAFTDATFVGNVAVDDGGATYGEGLTTLERASFRGNHAITLYGGAVLSDYGVIAHDVTFIDNGAGDKGGAVIAWDNTLTLADAVFRDNTSGTSGGAAYSWNGSVLVTDSTFEGNSSGANGAALWARTGTTSVIGSTFTSNIASGAGAAISASSDLHVTNSTFVANDTPIASGAIDASGSLLDVRNVTFVGNSGDLGDGAIVSTATATTIANSIFGMGFDGCDITSLTDLGGNIQATGGSGCIDGGQSRSTTATAAELDLGTLAANGGPTRTVAITDGSVAYGYARGTTDGTSAGALVCTESADTWSVASLDQRGYPRPRGAGCDSGAFEAAPTAAVYLDGSDYLGSPASCSNTSYTTIQDVVDAASSGDTIHVCEGTYDLTTAVYIRPDLTTLTFVGDGTSGSLTPTIVRSDPGVTTRLFTTDSHDPVAETLYHHAISFEGMTFRGGRGYNDYTRPAPTGSAAGGAIWVSGDVTLDHTEFVGNSANQYGGAVFARWGVAITSSTFTDNTSQTGGAVAACDDRVFIGATPATACDSTTATVVDSVFTGNTSTLDGGGAVYVEGSSGSSTQLVVTGSHFIANLASGGSTAYGGAIRADNADVSVVGGSFTENVAGIAGSSNDGYGGAIASRQDVRITGGTVFSGNFANNYGAGAVYADGDIESTGGSYLANFTSEYAGGGALYAAGTVFSDHDTFTGNTSGFGGAVYTDRAVVVRGSTFTDNESVYYEGGAIYVYCYSDCVPTELSGGTFTGNVAAADGGAIYVYCDWADCQPSSSGSTYTGNSTAVDSSGYGGAIWSNAGLRSRFDTFTGNTADGAGGAVYATESVDSSAATYVGNSSRNSEGGALWVDEVLTSLHDTFIDNTTGNSYGGAIFGSGSSPVDGISFAITDGTFIGNVADQEGGAIYLTGSIDVSGGTFERNESGYDGGAIYVTEWATVRSADFSANTAWRNGGAISAYYDVTIAGGAFTGNSTYNGNGGAILAGERVFASDARFDGNSVGGPGRSRYGGAIYACSNASTDACSNPSGYGDAASLERVEFSANTASEGGAIYVSSSGSLGSTDGTYIRNLATLNNGGAIYVDGGDVVSRLDTFRENSAGSGGAAIFAYGGAVDSSGGTYEDNTGATNHGGAVYADDRFTSLGDAFRRNSSGAYGGAVFANEAAITDGTFTDNTAGIDPYSVGGAVYSSGAVRIERSTFARNTAPAVTPGMAGGGGAVYSGAGIFALNSTFVGNAGYIGGALYAGAEITTRFVTFVDNTGTMGPTLAATGLADGNLDATATIFLGGDCDIRANTIADDDNLAAESNCSTTTTTRELLDLQPLALNAPGVTETVAITDGSSAYNHVTSANCTVSEDQRGFHRPQGGLCDAGAFEVAAATPAGAYIVGSSLPDATDTCADYATIAEAVADSVSGDTIHICGTHDLASSVTVDKSLTFEGDSSTDTIVDGGGARQLFLIPVGASYVTFEDLTLRNGYVYGDSGGAVRAALFTTVDLTFSNVIVHDNSTGGAGGAVFSWLGSVTITDSRFHDNTADYGGGAVFTRGGLSVERSRFEGNLADAGGGGASGGAVFAEGFGGALVSVTDATFVGNRAQYGGALASSSGTVIDGGEFSANTATASGGGLYSSGSITTGGAVFRDNVAAESGGAIWGGVAVNVIGGSFLGNTASSGDGGAIWSQYGADVSGGTFTANVARAGGLGGGNGGALYVVYLSAGVTGGTFTGNEADENGGAIFASSVVDVRVSGAIFTDNTAGAYGGAIDADGTSIRAGDVAVTDGTFTRNVAGTNGGAIHVDKRGSLRVDGGHFEANVGGYGGALRVKGDATLVGADFSANTGTIGGGGAIYGNCHLVVVGGSFTGNDASSGDGGAIYGESDTDPCGRSDGPGDIFIEISGNADFSANTAYGSGGAVFSYGPLAVTDGTFADNSASDGEGGAIRAIGDVTVTDSVFERNSVTKFDKLGGAIFGAARVTSIRSDYTGNTAFVGGGAIYAEGPISVSTGTFTGNTAGVAGGAIYGEDAISVLNGTFTGNVVNGAGGYGYGGAIYGDVVAVTDGTFTNNSTGQSFDENEYYDGGAIAGGTSVSIDGGTFTGNTANYGGAVSSEYSGAPIEISGATFIDNDATIQGGAVWSYDTATIVGGTFSGNRSAQGGAVYSYVDVVSDPSIYADNTAGEGGAIYVNGNVTTTDDTFERNSATSGDGGAIYAIGAVDVTRGRFFDNASATASGGAIHSGDALAVRGSTFARNRAGDSGSAIVLGAATGLIVNSTFADNTAGIGGSGNGAVYATGGTTLDVRNATFVGNQGTEALGAILGDAVSIANSIFGSATDECSISTIFDLGGNIDVTVGPTSACLDTLNQPLSKTVATAAELGLGSLALNAPGSTETVSISDGSAAIGYGVGTSDGLDGSPLICLDDADVAAVDQRGVSRTSGDQTGSACDSGAYENTTGIRFIRVPVPAIVTTQVSRATATNVDPFWDTATVSGTSGDGHGGFIDPVGEVQFFVCYDAVSAANCDWASETGTWDPLGDPIELSAGSSATDGIAARVTSDPVTGPDGWYVFHASFSSGDESVYFNAEDSGGTSETVRVAPVQIVLAYNGPVVVYTSTQTPASAQVALTASVSPNIRSCPVTFSVDPSSGVSPAGPYTAWTAGNGTATTSPVTFPAGTYSITVSTGGPCAGAPDFTGVLTVTEQTGTAGKGGSGGGWYKLNPPGPPKVSLGYAVKVSTVTSKVGRTSVVTTSTKGSLVWISKSGWRLKGVTDYSSTDGSTAWSVIGCDPGNPWGTLPATAKCGRFSGSGILQRFDGTTWVTSSYGRVAFTATTYDGGQVTQCGKKNTNCTTTQLPDYFAITMTSGVTQIRYTDSTYPPVNTNSGGTAIAPYGLQQGAIKVY